MELIEAMEREAISLLYTAGDCVDRKRRAYYVAMAIQVLAMADAMRKRTN